MDALCGVILAQERVGEIAVILAHDRFTTSLQPTLSFLALELLLRDVDEL